MKLNIRLQKLEQEIKPHDSEPSYLRLSPEEREQRIDSLIDKARQQHNPLSEAALTQAHQRIDDLLIKSGMEPIYSIKHGLNRPVEAR